MKRFALFSVGFLLLCSFGLNAAKADAPPPGGTVVIAKTGDDSLVLWDVTPLVASIVQDRTPRDEALHGLESQAVEVATSKAAYLTNAKTITVRIIYQKSGDLSPTYKMATFAGIERVVSVSVDKGALGKNAASFEHDLAAGKTPAGVTVDQTGQLPPL